MKRYGFTFEKHRGQDARSIDLRFFITIYSFFACILTLIYSGERDVTLYIFLCFIYLIFAFLPEVLPKVKGYPLLGLVAVVAYLSYLDKGKMFQGRVELVAIYGVYNTLVAITALYACFPKEIKANK
jgi:hypothetical protein